MAIFNGQLNVNEVLGFFYNMIISQQVYADNVALDDTLVNMARTDGGLYGDTKLYIATDVLPSVEWGADDEAANLLATKRPTATTEKLTLDQFRQIMVTIDEFMSKRAFSTPDVFSSFNSVVLGWLKDSRDVYDHTTYNAFIGTHKAEGAKQNVSVTLPVVEGDAEATNRLQAQTIAQAVADLLVEIREPSRDYNDLGYMRSFKADDLVLVWNSEVYNKITKLDLPTIFHKDGMFDGIKQYVAASKYFGDINEADKTADEATRALVEQIVDGKDIYAGEAVKVGETVDESYQINPNIACKIMHKNSVPYMSSFEVGTSFFNPKALLENHYLTFGRNTLDHLKNYPFITVTATPVS